jgi:hypothetical protein
MTHQLNGEHALLARRSTEKIRFQELLDLMCNKKISNEDKN